ncbi:GNAT family N-acetyltransferase [Paenibacillus sp. MMS20-IR301]|uniref:GNAT family N-acetyltransferase n=1 Tax=Paenibacillus sp. MMS20-IR301 TaxID=2895946 RepID=UPI0028EE21A0|nr:GNAT family N-acetyltransferase [Paenibacillus sp. MMS20-IR301]WNS41150.1 GNAT family N-acetyltransferase [Paenibacillus sp. MMS20-IR301]
MLSELTAEMIQELSTLLIEVVADGASIGFLPPLARDEAAAYWEGVPGPDVRLWVALEDGVVTGTVQLHPVMKPNAPHRAEVAKLMVHPAHRRKGLAAQLLETAEQAAAAEGRTLLVLDTREGDPSNLLYQSRGYIRVGRIPDYVISADGDKSATVIYYKQQ